MKFVIPRNIVTGIAVAALALGLSGRAALAAEEGAGAASEELPEITASAGLDVLQRFAELNNAGLKAAFRRWKAAMEKIPQATALPDPKLSYGHFIRSVETRVGPQQNKVGLAQMFPWFGKLRLRGDVAAREAEARFQEFEAARLALRREVADTWFELYYLRRAIGITEDNIQLMKHLEAVAQAKLKAGAAFNGVVKAQVELGRLADRLKTLNDLHSPLSARLNAALNRPPAAPLPWPDRLAASPAAFTDEQLIDWLREHNPDLRALERRVEKAESAIALARKDFYPDFTLGFDYVQTGDALAPTTPGNSKDAVMAMFSINIPLWRGKYRAGVREAELNREAVRESRAETENRLLARLKLAAYRFRDAERKVNLYGDTLVPQAKGALDVAQESYEAGKADFLDLIDAQRLLLNFQLELERARADREQRRAELEMLVGRDLSGAPAQP